MPPSRPVAAARPRSDTNPTPQNATVVCPLYPNAWGVTTWGPFTAFRLTAPNATELFRFSSRWRQVMMMIIMIMIIKVMIIINEIIIINNDNNNNNKVLVDPRPMQFDEWWGTPPHHWRMSQA